MQTFLRNFERPVTGARIRSTEMQADVDRITARLEQIKALTYETPDLVTWEKVSDLSHYTKLLENAADNMGG